MSDLSAIYRTRFANTGIEKRARVWKLLCKHYFSRYIKAESTVLDVACGYGEFINNIVAARKYAVDLNPDAKSHLNVDVLFKLTRADQLDHIEDSSLDVAFTSNFLEHLPDKSACNDLLQAVLAKLKPGGQFIIMGPNIRFTSKEYWDYYDHYLPLSHRSLAEGLIVNGYDIDNVIDRFLPYTMNNNTPTSDLLIIAYLKMPFMWRFFGKQFLVTARRPK